MEFSGSRKLPSLVGAHECSTWCVLSSLSSTSKHKYYGNVRNRSIRIGARTGSMARSIFDNRGHSQGSASLYPFRMSKRGELNSACLPWLFGCSKMVDHRKRRKGVKEKQGKKIMKSQHFLKSKVWPDTT